MKYPPNHYHLVPRSNPFVKKYADTLKTYEEKKLNRFTITVAPSVVEQGDISMLQEIIMAAQHFPKAMAQLIFGIEFKFEQIEDSELMFQEIEWKTNPANQRWFFKMGQATPWLVFFMRDRDVRSYMLMQDIVEKGEGVEMENVEGREEQRIGFSPQNTHLIENRVFSACLYFMFYCYPDVNPDEYMDAVISDTSASFGVEDVRKEFLSQQAKGFRWRAVSKSA